MKVKSVTIETDNGDEITMGFDEVDDFMKAMRRLKKSCQPEPESEGPTGREILMQQQLQMEVYRLQAEKQLEEVRRLQTRNAGQQIMTTGTKYEVQGATGVKLSDLDSLIGNNC